MGLLDIFSTLTGGGGGGLLGMFGDNSGPNPPEGAQFGRTDSFGLGTVDSFGRSGSRSYVDPTQNPFLQSLRQMAMGAANPAQAQRTSQRMVGSVMPGLQQQFATLAGFNPQSQIAAQSGSLKAELGDLFGNQIMPALQSDAIAAGGFGGGRQGVAEGVATGKIADAFTQGYGEIVANANSQAIDAASMAGALGDSIYNLGMSPTTAAFGPLTQLADILGGPTVLTEAGSRQGSTQRKVDATQQRQGSLNVNPNHHDDMLSKFPALANLFGATPWTWPTANSGAVSANPLAPRGVYRRGGSAR